MTYRLTTIPPPPSIPHGPIPRCLVLQNHNRYPNLVATRLLVVISFGRPWICVYAVIACGEFLYQRTLSVCHGYRLTSSGRHTYLGSLADKRLLQGTRSAVFNDALEINNGLMSRPWIWRYIVMHLQSSKTKVMEWPNSMSNAGVLQNWGPDYLP